MFTRLRRLPLAIIAVVAALLLGACGNSHTRVTTGSYAGETGVGAPYLNVGPLIYQVQLSRQLNPYDTEDAAYLQGLRPAERRLALGQEWLGVFIQVYNHQSVALPAAPSMTITDTQGNTYTPLSPDQTNAYSYRGGTVPPKSELPIPDSAASFGPMRAWVTPVK